MRKTKELKRMRREAGFKARRGDWADARKGWTDAAKGYAARLEAKKPVKKEEAAPSEG